MAESRDRLSRPGELRATFARRRQSMTGGISILLDEEQEVGNTPRAARGGVRRGTLTLGTPRSNNPNELGRNPRRKSAASFRRGRGIIRSGLPSWYPRKPLQDITAIMRVIERRRARLRESEGLQIDSPITKDQDVLVHSDPASGAQIEHDLPKTLLVVTSQKAGELDGLTPQKKLLNCIDTVEKEVMEELQKLKVTPSAKKAERQKRVRTLMSMR